METRVFSDADGVLLLSKSQLVAEIMPLSNEEKENAPSVCVHPPTDCTTDSLIAGDSAVVVFLSAPKSTAFTS